MSTSGITVDMKQVPETNSNMRRSRHIRSHFLMIWQRNLDFLLIKGQQKMLIWNTCNKRHWIDSYHHLTLVFGFSRKWGGRGRGSVKMNKAKLLKVKLVSASKDYSGVIAEAGFILKEDEDNLDALLLRGHAYYYLADHDVAQRHYQKGLRLDPEHGELKKAYFGSKS